MAILQQVPFPGSREGLGAALYTQFAVDVVDVGLDGAHGQKQPFGVQLALWKQPPPSKILVHTLHHALPVVQDGGAKVGL